MIYNCIDGTVIETIQEDGVWLYNIKDRYGDVICKNLSIDIFKDKLKLPHLLDKYNIIKVSLEQYDYNDLRDTINSIKKKLINLHILDCNKLILDSKLISKDNIEIKTLVPYVDYRYINQFKDTINELDKPITFKEIIVYLPDKYIWTDIIYDFKNLTSKLKIITQERGLYISSNIEPYTDLRKVNIINQLWTTFDLTIDICLNKLGDTVDSEIIAFENNKNEINLDDSDEILSELDSKEFIDKYIDIVEDPFSRESFTDINNTESDFYSNYGFLDKEDSKLEKINNISDINSDIVNSSDDFNNLFYKYEVNFNEGSNNPEISKKALEFLKKKDLYWFDIINTFINKTPNIYELDFLSDSLKYIIPNRINNISNFNPSLSKVKVINNYTHQNGIISDIFDYSLGNYTNEALNIQKKG